MSMEDVTRKASSLGVLIIPRSPNLRQYAAFRLCLGDPVFARDVPRRFDEALLHYAEASRLHEGAVSVSEEMKQLKAWAAENGKILVPMKGSRSAQTTFFTHMRMEPKTRSARGERFFERTNAKRRGNLDEALARLAAGEESSAWATITLNVVLSLLGWLLMFAAAVLLTAAFMTLGTRQMFSYTIQGGVLFLVGFALMSLVARKTVRRRSYPERMRHLPAILSSSILPAAIFVLSFFGFVILTASYNDMRINEMLQDLMLIMRDMPKSAPGVMT